MIYGQYKISMSIGKALASDIITNEGVLHKGHIISADDVVTFQMMGIEFVTATHFSDDDFSLENAQNVISNKLCGENVTYAISQNSSVDILAMKDGFFVADIFRVEKFCLLSKEIKINIIPSYKYVKKGDIVAIVDFPMPIYSKEYINSLIFSLSGNSDMFSVVSDLKKRVAVVYVRFYHNVDEEKHFASSVAKLVEKTLNMEMDFVGEYFAKYNSDDVADQIQNAKEKGAEVIFIISSISSTGQNSVIHKAVSEVCDFVYNEGFSKVEFLDILYAARKKIKVLVLPKLYNKISSSFVDELVYKVLIREKISIEHLLNKDFYIEENLYDNDEFKDYKKLATVDEISQNVDEIAVIVLAAGTSRRTTNNKLLYDVNGELLFIKSVKSAIEAKVGPVFVVTGYQSEEFVKALADYDVNIITNSGYKDGVKSSINLGIDFVPSFCKGVVILPADMPNVSAKHIRAMALKFDNTKDKELIVSSCGGVRSNPLLWSRGLFSFADIFPEDTAQRQVFMAFEDVIKEVEVKDKLELLDVNFPADIETLLKNSKGKNKKKFFGF